MSDRSCRITDVAKRIASSGYGLISIDVAKVTSLALPAQPHRVALPSQAGGFLLESVLEEPFRTEHLQGELRFLPPHRWGSIPKACHEIDRESEVQFARRLIDIGLGELV